MAEHQHTRGTVKETGYTRTWKAVLDADAKSIRIVADEGFSEEGNPGVTLVCECGEEIDGTGWTTDWSGTC